MEPGTAKGRNWAIALVHGIGAAKPMEMIEQVSQAIKTHRPDLDLNGPVEAHKIQKKKR